MKTTFLIILVKLVTFVGKLIGKNASVFPGKLAYDRDHGILKKIKYPKLVIAVTGSSGKGSTTELIAHILKNAGLSVAYNKEGSNGIYGITTLILNNTSLFQKFKKDVLLAEVDERHLKLAFDDNLSHLVITNITRDQPARSGYPEMIYEEIFKNIKESTTLIINADDPLIHKTRWMLDNKVYTFGIAKTKESFRKHNLNNIDHAYCPICHVKLKYNFYHYGHLGTYRCPKCEFKRGIVDYEATGIDLTSKRMLINNLEITLNYDILYAAYNTLAAFSLAKTIGIKEKTILYSLNEATLKPKRANTYELDNRKINMLESKNENAVSYYQSLKYIVNQKGQKTVILGFDNVSRRYKYNDLSWLWDVEFELLKNNNIDKIICIGKYKWDIATRLSYAQINDQKLILLDNINDLINITKNQSKGDIFTMVCFDMTENIKSLIKGEIHEN